MPPFVAQENRRIETDRPHSWATQPRRPTWLETAERPRPYTLAPRPQSLAPSLEDVNRWIDAKVAERGADPNAALDAEIRRLQSWAAALMDERTERTMGPLERGLEDAVRRARALLTSPK